MPRIGEPGASPAARVGFELGLLASSIVVRHVWREYFIPSVDPGILPMFLELGAGVIGYNCFIYSSLFFVLDAIDSPYARGWRQGRI